jgi:curli biogenesis system outer membrane secretion channel CsgG
MKKAILFFFCLSAALGLSGCAGISLSGQRGLPAERIIPHYTGPKARLAVAEFDVKTEKAGGQIGAGLKNILTDGLTGSRRFELVEYNPQGRSNTADLIISVSVTEFASEASGGSSGVGGGGGINSGIMGGLLGTSANKARMAVDVRIVDAATSVVIASQYLQGQAADNSGTLSGTRPESWEVNSALKAYSGTPMEKAIRICLREAERFINEKVPGKYYKY